MAAGSPRRTLARTFDDSMANPSASSTEYALSRWLFLRLLGVVYLVAFGSLAVQITGLVGAPGFMPAGAFLEWARSVYGPDAYRFLPTIFWLGAGDAALRVAAWSGILLALLVVGGVASRAALALLWALYLSLSVAGQDFLSFQWDALLLEAGLLATLWAPPGWRPRREAPPPSAAIRWLLVFLVFKLMFLSGATKLLEWRSHVAPAHSPGLPLRDPAAPDLDRVVCPSAPRPGPSGCDGGDVSDRARRPLASVRAGAPPLPQVCRSRRPRVAAGGDRAHGELRILQPAGGRTVHPGARRRAPPQGFVRLRAGSGRRLATRGGGSALLVAPAFFFSALAFLGGARRGGAHAAMGAPAPMAGSRRSGRSTATDCSGS